MSEFSELVKRFDKIRDYMRDFYVYGFKSRADFTKKSARTYDNEKRRVESYLGDYMKWDYSGGSKTMFVSMDCARLSVNPLFAAWKSKSFTNNDVILHFTILDILQHKSMTAEALTDEICAKSERIFDIQTVRNKCREYVKNGILTQEQRGKAFVYALSPEAEIMTPELLEAVSFFQGAAPFGEIGSYLLDREDANNDLFAFKHYYPAHTLESGVLLDILAAIREQRAVLFHNHSERSGKTTESHALPLKIFVSVGTGRRFVCAYSFQTRRFCNFRLDYIKKVTPGDVSADAETLRKKLDTHLDKVWGVGFGQRNRTEKIIMTLRIDEQREQFILERLRREGQGGAIVRLEENVFQYTKEVFDSNDMTPWIKTFTGRILSLEGTNKIVIRKFYDDIRRMAELYEGGGRR